MVFIETIFLHGESECWLYICISSRVEECESPTFRQDVIGQYVMLVQALALLYWLLNKPTESFSTQNTLAQVHLYAFLNGPKNADVHCAAAPEPNISIMQYLQPKVWLRGTGDPSRGYPSCSPCSTITITLQSARKLTSRGCLVCPV